MPSEDYIDLAEHIEAELGFDINKRSSAALVNWPLKFAIVSVLKNQGARYLLLSAIDSKSFPPYSEKGKRAKLSRAWHRIYGSKTFHVNGTKEDMTSTLAKLGSLEHLEGAACLKAISPAVLEELRNSRERRRLALDSSVLDLF